jgi:N-acetylneuraminate synthase/sialic acid synthase
MAQINLDGTTINETSAPYIIAEIGHNHMGDVDIALQMIDEAAAAGADCVKFQRIDAEKLFTKAAYAEAYNSENAFAPTYGQHRDALTLSDDDFRRVFDRCQEVGVSFACTPFEEWSADFIHELGCEIFKMASFHMHDSSLIFHVAAFDKPMILSTGNSTKTDIRALCDSLHGFPENDKYALLHCTSEYPVHDPSHINLGAISSMIDEFGHVIWGYSHHHVSPFTAAASYFFGARIIEAHFTLDRTLKGTDQSFSLDPDGLRWLVNQAHLAHMVCGTRKTPYREESAPIRKMSRSVYPKCVIGAGEIITADNIELRAPGDGMRPDQIAQIIGRVSARELKPEKPIVMGDYK